MKYLVQLKYTNPAHEHVSLRRRVDTITRIVEAATEEEAINRSARQQRALGYLIQEAKVIDSDAKKESKEQLLVKEDVKEEVDIDENLMGAIGDLATVHAAGGLTPTKKPAASKPTSKPANVSGKKPGLLNRIGKAVNKFAFNEASKEGKDVMRGMRASMKSMDLRHGVDSDKREAGYKMSPAVKAAQAKSDALSKVVKRPQAGTLAAAKMKNEAMDPNEAKGEKKIVKTSKKAAKAAEKMVNAAKGKMNKINLTPELEPGKSND